MAGYSGDGSYQKLIASIYGANKTNKTLTQKYKEQNQAVRPDQILIQSIQSFSRFGIYSIETNSPNGPTLYGYFWERKANNIYATHLNFNTTYIYATNSNPRINGYSLRCVAK